MRQGNAAAEVSPKIQVKKRTDGTDLGSELRTRAISATYSASPLLSSNSQSKSNEVKHKDSDQQELGGHGYGISSSTDRGKPPGTDIPSLLWTNPL